MESSATTTWKATGPTTECGLHDASGIQVSMTPDVQVYGNTLVNNAKGIGAIHWDHDNVGSVTKCKPQLRNLRVYNNSITQNGSAAAGIDASIDETWCTAPGTTSSTPTPTTSPAEPSTVPDGLGHPGRMDRTRASGSTAIR